MGTLTFLKDRLINVMSGMGTTADKRTAAFYSLQMIDPQQAEAAYRSSGLVRKIIDIPPFDMTREWRDWQAEAPDIEKLEAEEKRLQLRAKCQRALVLARLYGGGALILGMKDGNPSAPLGENTGAGGLKYIHAMSRHQLGHGQQLTDPEDPWFGHPEYFEIRNGQGSSLRIHPSRVVAFVGQRLPEGALQTGDSWFWGDPIMQSIGDAVKNVDLAQSGFSALIDEARLDIIKLPKLTEMASTAEYETRLLNRFAAAAAGKSTWRMLAIDGDEEWEQREVSWAGIPDIMAAFQEFLAGVADIPLTRLLGQSPKGLQSTGDGEERDYHAMVRARQNELLAPALDRIDDLLIPSALGSRPADIYYEFAPLSQETETTAADIEDKAAKTIQTYALTGLIPDQALSAMAKNRIIESGRWPGSEKAFEEAAVEAENEPEPDEEDPSALVAANENTVAAMTKRKAITADQARVLLSDASPRSLYVRRDVVNVAEIKAWAEGQGIADLRDDLHVTVIYSTTPMDWLKAGNASEWGSNDGKLTIAPGGPRVVEPLGDMTAVLMFASSELGWRHRAIIEAGAAHGYEDYIPHVSLTKAPVDLSAVEPYRGKIVLGPEVFEEVDAG